jgi:hypothetical protein
MMKTSLFSPSRFQPAPATSRVAASRPQDALQFGGRLEERREKYIKQAKAAPVTAEEQCGTKRVAQQEALLRSLEGTPIRLEDGTSIPFSEIFESIYEHGPQTSAQLIANFPLAEGQLPVFKDTLERLDRAGILTCRSGVYGFFYHGLQALKNVYPDLMNVKNDTDSTRIPTSKRSTGSNER